MTSMCTLEEIESMLWPHIRDLATIKHILRTIETYAWQHKQQPPQTRPEPPTCRQCSGPLPPRESRYCSPACFRIWHYTANGITPQCLHCRTPIPEATATGAQYCGDECGKQARQEAQTNKREFNPWQGPQAERFKP